MNNRLLHGFSFLSDPDDFMGPGYSHYFDLEFLRQRTPCSVAMQQKFLADSKMDESVYLQKKKSKTSFFS